MVCYIKSEIRKHKSFFYKAAIADEKPDFIFLGIRIIVIAASHAAFNIPESLVFMPDQKVIAFFIRIFLAEMNDLIPLA